MTAPLSFPLNLCKTILISSPQYTKPSSFSCPILASPPSTQNSNSSTFLHLTSAAEPESLKKKNNPPSPSNGEKRRGQFRPQIYGAIWASTLTLASASPLT